MAYYIFLQNSSPVKFVALFLLVVLLISCEEKNSSSIVFDYFQEADLLEEGVVSKYYEHFYPKEKSSDPRTNISYSLVQKISESSYTTHWYNAGFELTSYNEFSIEEGKVLQDSSVRFYGEANLDTALVEIKNPVFEVWEGEPGDGLQEFLNYNGDEWEIEKIQNRILDSVIMHQPAKILIGIRNVKSTKQDTIFNIQYAFTYVKGLGLYSQLTTRENGRFVKELIEQMPVSAFLELCNHDKKRVAYIDPSNTIDNTADFELCGGENRIVDYYNSSDDVRYLGDKGEMMKIIRSKTEREKLNEESGYLTFRFVVNCKGIAGRFVIEQSSLDYEDKQFERETIDHLYQITSWLEKWRPPVIRDEPRDAYMYVTYKLQNGVITDVLP